MVQRIPWFLLIAGMTYLIYGETGPATAAAMGFYLLVAESVIHRKRLQEQYAKEMAEIIRRASRPAVEKLEEAVRKAKEKAEKR